MLGCYRAEWMRIMQAITTEQMATLVKLQSIEIETNRIHQKLSAVEKKLESLDAEVQGFAKGIEDSDTRLDVLKKLYRSHESDTDLNLSRIKKSQEKLRAVKNNKEYQSILKEIEDIELINSEIEDKMLECLDEIETAERSYAQKKAEYEQLKAHVNDEKGVIRQEVEAGEKRLSELEMEWKEVSGKIDPTLMKTYKTVRENRDTAVVAVENATCLGCHLNIPHQLYNELHRCDSLTFCPHCQRIIYWKDSVE